MQFANPWYLPLLAAPLALLLWSAFKSAPAIIAPVADGSLRRQPVTTAILKAGLMLPPLLLACLILLLAGPVVDQQVASRNPARATNIEVLLNASRSMLGQAEIGHHCRYCAAKKAIEGFVGKRHGNTMGISIFGSRHLDLVPLTADLNAVVHSVSETYPDYIAFRIAHEKDFAAGFAGSIAKLAEKTHHDSEQILILVTDGESPGLARHEEEIRNQLAEHRVTLYVALIADDQRATTLARLAEATPGGKLFVCRDALGFAEVMRHIDRMNTIVYQDVAPRPVYDQQWLLVTATILTALFALALATPFRPTPW